jgi:predicted nucleic acid-binding protein
VAARAAVTFIDTNIIIDIFGRDARWFDWSAARLSAAQDARTNAIVVAELSRNFARAADLWSKLGALGLTSVVLDDESGFLAGKRFQTYRTDRDGAERARVLPDFLIGAHAVMLKSPLLTRDPKLYRRYFPELTLITPETHP